MSSLVDIWTVERERIRVSGAQAFRTTVASKRGCTARSDDGQNKPDGAAVETAAKKQQAAAVGGAPASERYLPPLLLLTNTNTYHNSETQIQKLIDN
uniref:Uncharacterized protein n=1 Tax=Oryza nivara TaxID=4536 RepID=A0A0E0GU90_ORYNI